MLERAGAGDENRRELSSQLEACQARLAEEGRVRSELTREKNGLSQSLAVAQTELRGKEVMHRHAEQRLLDEKMALQARMHACIYACICKLTWTCPCRVYQPSP